MGPRAAVSEGLSRVLRDTPLHGGYLDLGASMTKLRGPEAWVETGIRPALGHTVFARGFANTSDYGIMGGWRWEF